MNSSQWSEPRFRTTKRCIVVGGGRWEREEEGGDGSGEEQKCVTGDGFAGKVLRHVTLKTGEVGKNGVAARVGHSEQQSRLLPKLPPRSL